MKEGEWAGMSERRTSSERRKMCMCLILLAALLAWPVDAGCEQKSTQGRRTIEAGEFLKTISRCTTTSPEAKLESCDVKGKIDWGSDEIKRIRCGLEIRDTVFENDFRMYGENTTFDRRLYFSNCTFKGAVAISFAKFRDGIGFDRCNFENDVILNDITISKKTGFPLRFQSNLFSECSFSRKFKMFQSNCLVKVNFSECHFLDDAFFGRYPFRELDDFLNGRQDKERHKVIFADQADFTRSQFKGRAYFPYAEFTRAKFSEVLFEG
ncbi:MAG TPA: hypothetical protein VMS71_07000, partial [Candidatus Acidoferrum sp.]|nr:hypothetical protein [Candidatus Acidoferrum sp.]